MYPAIKAPYNKEALWEALLDDRLEVMPPIMRRILGRKKAFSKCGWEPHPVPLQRRGGLTKKHMLVFPRPAPLLLPASFYKPGKITLEKISAEDESCCGRLLSK